MQTRHAGLLDITNLFMALPARGGCVKPDRLAAQRLNIADCFETENSGRAGTGVFFAEGQQSADSSVGVEESEQSDEIIVRLVELDGKPQPDVRVAFGTPITAAREVNGQEQPVASTAVSGGALSASFSAYQRAPSR